LYIFYAVQFPASINNEDNTINIARDLPAGVHLYENITGKIINNNSNLTFNEFFENV